MRAWSIKDVLAHIVAWEREAAARLRLIARGQGHRILFYTDTRAADRFNVRAVRRARRQSLRALLRQATRVRRQLTRELRRLPAQSLDDRTQRWPVIAWLPEFAWTHEQEHLRRIRAWWCQRRAKQ